MNENIKNGLVGGLIGATVMFGGIEVGVKDTDPKTGESYEEVVNNPEKDVYYNFPVESLNAEYWKKSHEKADTARYSNDGNNLILKFDIGELPRGEEYPEPMNQEEVLEFLSDCNNGYCPDEL